MFLFNLKPSYRNFIYWQNPKYKLVNYESIINCFSLFSQKPFNLNWTSQRHFWINIENVEDNIFYNKYFLLSPVNNKEELLKNKLQNWHIIFVNSFEYLNQQKKLIRVYFEVDSFFSLVKHATTSFKISGMIHRTTLPKYTYKKYYVLDQYKQKQLFFEISPNVILQEQFNLNPYLLTKLDTLFTYNDSTKKDLYFYLVDNNTIKLRKKNIGDLVNNIIRKPLFISNQSTVFDSKDNIVFITSTNFLINNKQSDLELLKNVFNDLTYNAFYDKFKNEKFLIILPIFYNEYSYYFDNHIPYNSFYPNTFLIKKFTALQEIDSYNIGYAMGSPNLDDYIDIKFKWNFQKTTRYLVITYNNFYLGFENSIVDFELYKTTPSILKSNISFDYSRYPYINKYLDLDLSSIEPTILDTVYFNHPETKIKAGFLNASPNEILELLKVNLLDILDSSNTSIISIFNTYIKDWKSKLTNNVEEFLTLLKQVVFKESEDYKDYIKFGKNKTTSWQEFFQLQKLQFKESFNIDFDPDLDPKLSINKNFINYFIYSPNTKQDLDLDLFFNKKVNIKIINKKAFLFNYHYSENEMYDSGYSLLSYPFYNKNFVNKYLKNDTITSNSYVEYLKQNQNSINFQKQRESIMLARARQDRYLAIFNGISSIGLNIAQWWNNTNYTSQIGYNGGLYGSIGKNIIGQNLVQNINNIINMLVHTNRGIEDSKMAIASWYAKQSDLTLENRVDQNIIGIENYLELKEVDCSVFKQTASDHEIQKANIFLRKWGWQVNESFTDLPYNNNIVHLDTNTKYDYVELDYLDNIAYLSQEDNIYLQHLFKLGIWLVYDVTFTPETFFSPQPSLTLDSNANVEQEGG